MLTINHRAGEDGKLFGSVTNAEIAEAIPRPAASRVDRKKIRLDDPIREIGTYMVEIEVGGGADGEGQDDRRRRRLAGAPSTNVPDCGRGSTSGRSAAPSGYAFVGICGLTFGAVGPPVVSDRAAVAGESAADGPLIRRAMATAETHVPPQNLEAEESVLGALMVSDLGLDRVILDVRLEDRDFYRGRHRPVFRAIKGLYERGESIDVITVADYLRSRGELDDAGGRDTISHYASVVPAPGNAKHYAEIVKRRRC